MSQGSEQVTDSPPGRETVPLPDDDRPRRRRRWYADLPILIVTAVVLALLIKTFLVQAFYIPSPSMHPTLVENDRVLVNRMAYRFHEPRRGDVIVFQNPHPKDPSQSAFTAFKRWLEQGLGFSAGGRNKDFIKRVIGVPGDTVEIDRGVVYVNGTALDEPYVSSRKDLGSYGPYVVPAGNLFVLGDNRTDSDDSRGSLGFIPIDKVLGRAFAIVWPPGRWTWLSGVDYGPIPEAHASPATAPPPMRAAEPDGAAHRPRTAPSVRGSVAPA